MVSLFLGNGEYDEMEQVMKGVALTLYGGTLLRTYNDPDKQYLAQLPRTRCEKKSLQCQLDHK